MKIILEVLSYDMIPNAADENISTHLNTEDAICLSVSSVKVKANERVSEKN